SSTARPRPGPKTRNTRTSRSGWPATSEASEWGTFSSMSDVDRLVELITQRVKERLHSDARPHVKLNVLPRDRGECNDDAAPGEDCTECGSCVVRRPWSVRAMEGAGAMRVGAPAGIGEVPQDLAKLIDHTLLK